MKNVVIRTSPNISPNAGHYGHALTFLVSYWVAKALNGRAIVRIDWQLKTKGSMHRDASEYERKQRQLGFDRIYNLAKLCGISEVIDEYGIRHSLDGIQRCQRYRVFRNEENNVPIIYEYSWNTLSPEGLRKLLIESSPKISRLPLSRVNKKLPLIMEHTHVCLSGFPKDYISRLKELCIETKQPPRRFNKAYCHIKMDSLLGVTHIVRGDDFHSNRIYMIHEKNLNKEWNIPLFPLIRIPIICSNGQKISASEEDGVVGLFPTNISDIENMIRILVKPEYLRYFLPKINHHWFVAFLRTDNPIIDAPFWSYKEL